MSRSDSDFTVHMETPSIDDYCRLRLISGLSPKSREAAAIGLPNTICGVTIKLDGKAVGMGRIVGDRGCFYQVVDIAVDPEHQARGLGKRIMTALKAYLDAEGQEGAYVSLVADGPAKYLYAKFGFEPVTPEAIGMAYRVTRS
ncbi:MULTISPECIES: GNAT family N-acetyltransferase [unclassified Phyllobacterium]|uniref:GNAT family N-acetyltransferase n=1 Tax=Phyllobacterium TaxID=28100 RepID=UPI000DD76E1B|nr:MULTISPECIES: GNAT family N-acetyltransferase [unclassified Phyllobacterium]MBA8902702.1 ribosomal protein S18 acetylase RimI-like enzyme [Phyllobacterium sp. P30BS-XVII]UGX87474.1 GNAT family N-acetyltransferase [Phyllobacterium sp. T1293]